MKRIINIICAIDLVFILLLFVSSLIGEGILSDVIYYLSFIVPLLLGAYFVKRERPYTEEVRTVRFSISKKGAVYVLPLIVPTVSIIMAISRLTSLLLGLFGVSGESDAEGGILFSVLVYALVPAVLEEVLFRFVPMRLLLPYSRSAAVIISALMFALIHMDLFIIPYAFAAGILFALIDLECESVLPSMAIHFVNNLSSVLLMKTGARVGAVIYPLLGALALISLAAILVKRESYARLFSPLREHGEKQSIGYAPAAVLILSLFIGFSSLFIQ